MAIVDADIKYRLSGGSGNTDPNASLGTTKSSTEVVDNTVDNLFDDVSGDEASAGDTEYRCIYVHNNHGSLTWISPKIWITSNTTSTGDEIDIGLGTSAVNGTEQDLTGSGESTAPSGVSFSHPTTKSGGLSPGNIPSGQHKAIWIRRVVGALTGAKDANAGTFKSEGDSAE